jgi:segregation and condensation protein B
MRLTQIIEALLFASDAPLTPADLARVDEQLDEDTVEAVIQELRSEYESTERSFQVYELAGGYQILTRPEFVTVLERYDTVPQPSRLSNSALEVLAIIAYRQPLGRAEVEEIRGVGSSGVLRTLMDRNLIEAVGRAEGLGRPLLYGTTAKFLEHFGYRSLEDLPRPDELPVVLLSQTPIVISADPSEGTPAEAALEVVASEHSEAAVVNEAAADAIVDAVEHSDAPDASDAREASDAPDASDAREDSDAPDASDAREASDAPDAALDESEAQDDVAYTDDFYDESDDDHVDDMDDDLSNDVEDDEELVREAAEDAADA